ncbi:MAG: Unknown protein, partial [uncultured Sulfurovum sp.]
TSKEFLHHGKISDIKTKEIMYDNLNMIYVEIPKLKKEKKDLNSHLEWWLYVFQNLSQLQEIPQALKGDVIEKAFEKAEFINLPKVEQDKYHKNLKVYRDLINSLDTAHEQGKVEGKIEGQMEEKIKIAKKLMNADMSVDFISETTGLSVEEIEDLRREL